MSGSYISIDVNNRLNSLYVAGSYINIGTNGTISYNGIQATNPVMSGSYISIDSNNRVNNLISPYTLITNGTTLSIGYTLISGINTFILNSIASGGSMSGISYIQASFTGNLAYTGNSSTLFSNTFTAGSISSDWTISTNTLVYNGTPRRFKLMCRVGQTSSTNSFTGIVACLVNGGYMGGQLRATGSNPMGYIGAFTFAMDGITGSIDSFCCIDGQSNTSASDQQTRLGSEILLFTGDQMTFRIVQAEIGTGTSTNFNLELRLVSI